MYPESLLVAALALIFIKCLCESQATHSKPLRPARVTRQVAEG